MIGLTRDYGWRSGPLWSSASSDEANLVKPEDLGVAAKITGTVVLALIIGEHFFGLWGALLGVPVLSIAQSIFQHFRFESMPDAPPDSMVPVIRTAPRA